MQDDPRLVYHLSTLKPSSPPPTMASSIGLSEWDWHPMYTRSHGQSPTMTNTVSEDFASVSSGPRSSDGLSGCGSQARRPTQQQQPPTVQPSPKSLNLAPHKTRTTGRVQHTAKSIDQIGAVGTPSRGGGHRQQDSRARLDVSSTATKTSSTPRTSPAVRSTPLPLPPSRSIHCSLQPSTGSLSRSTSKSSIPVSSSSYNLKSPPHQPTHLSNLYRPSSSSLSSDQATDFHQPTSPSTPFSPYHDLYQSDPHPHPAPVSPLPISPFSMYALSTFYLLPHLTSLCHNRIIYSLTPENAMPTLLASSLYEDLRISIEDYVITRWADIVGREEFERCAKEVARGDVWGGEQGGRTLTSLFRRLQAPR